MFRNSGTSSSGLGSDGICGDGISLLVSEARYHYLLQTVLLLILFCLSLVFQLQFFTIFLHHASWDVVTKGCNITKNQGMFVHLNMEHFTLCNSDSKHISCGLLNTSYKNHNSSYFSSVQSIPSVNIKYVKVTYFSH